MKDKVDFTPVPLNRTFTAPIGVNVKGDMWSCVEMPGSAEFFGTRKSIRVDVEVDGLSLPNIGFMVTGTGGHMMSVSAKLRKQLGKDMGETVSVRLLRRIK
jgi:hypothetical protein